MASGRQATPRPSRVIWWQAARLEEETCRTEMSEKAAK
eukprot:CAMPEP_0184410040 /NCGR_PEP_ID=MMETSP0738-20130409/4559_1 /TAXON_ID=385413 /ORGANISM="Thalassiosira miniscula, Strain CCMP1093" /LENGTH=37 /DNA_ID= /DNA_START= /DNA_END= /DNA_ORIENTATION=